MEEENKNTFAYQLRKYLTMIIDIWPSIRPALKDLSEIQNPPQDSFLPQRPYNTMNGQQFIKTIVDDLFDFIMNHDVKEEDLQNYLYDILDLLLINQQTVGINQIGGASYMATQLFKVINQLQQDKFESVKKFEQNVYEKVKQMGIGEVIVDNSKCQQQQASDSQSENNNQMDEQQDWQQQEEQEQSKNNENKQQKIKTEEEVQKQKQMEDDGWVIVRK